MLISELFLPFLITHKAYSKVFQSVSTVLYFFGEVSQALPTGEAFQRLNLTRQFKDVVRQISFAKMDKIPFLARLLHAYMGSTLPDSDRVKIFMNLKNILVSVEKASSVGSATILFLAAFNAIADYPIHTITSRVTLYHLSECLNILNEYKSSLMQACRAERHLGINQLLLQSSAAVHVLAAIVKAGVSMDNAIFSDFVSILATYLLSHILDESCPISMQKAILNLLSAYLKKRDRDAPLNELTRSAGLILQNSSKELLATAMVLFSDILNVNTFLSTSYVKGLLNSDPSWFKSFLDGIHAKKEFVIDWELPFMLNAKYEFEADTDWSICILLGCCKKLEGAQTLSFRELTLINSVMSVVVDRNDHDRVSQSLWDEAFLVLSDYLMIHLPVPESCQMAWNVWSSLAAICSSAAVKSVKRH